MSAIQATEQTAPLPEAARLEEMVQDIIAQARAVGADEVEAGVSFDAGLSVTVRLGETETLEFNRDRVLGLTVYFDHRKGTATTGADHKGMMFTITAPIGGGEFRASYGNLKANDTTVLKRIALGYHYSMSKRTTLYVDFANDSEAASSKSGYDVGIKHNF